MAVVGKLGGECSETSTNNCIGTKNEWLIKSAKAEAYLCTEEEVRLGSGFEQDSYLWLGTAWRNVHDFFNFAIQK